VKTRDIVDLVVLGVIWGSSFLFMRIAAPEFGPVSLVTVRVGIAAVFLLITLALIGGFTEMWRKAGALIALGLLNSVIGFCLFAYAVLYLTSGFAAMLNSTVPLFGAVVAYLWLGEKLTPRRIAGLIAGFVGVLVLVWGRVSFGAGGAGFAVLAGLTASLSYAIGASFTKKHLSGVDALVTAAGSHLAATAILLPPALLYWPRDSPSTRSWLSAIALGTICTGVAYILFFRLIARVGPTRTITVTYLIPVFAMIWGLAILHEPVTARMILACVVIFAGTALASGAVGS
jgi:drug/metabolite transporter (DMT)-like permease